MNDTTKVIHSDNSERRLIEQKSFVNFVFYYWFTIYKIPDVAECERIMF